MSRRRRYGLGKTAAIMLALAIALGWVSVFMIPAVTRLGVPPVMAQKLPYAGFAVGLAWGVGIAFSDSARAALGYLVAPPLVGAVFWFFAVLLGGVLVGFGLSPEAADDIPLAGFVLGALFGSAPLLVRSADALATLRSRVARRD